MEKLRSPLQWPAGWPRTEEPRDSLFGKMKSEGDSNWKSKRRLTIEDATLFLSREIRLLTKSDDFILSTNLKYRDDGLPYSKQRQPEDQGAAVYFIYNKKETALACDTFNRIADNIYAIGKTIERLRGMERDGCSELMNKAFTGFQALPEKGSGKPWWEYFGLPINATEDDLKTRYRAMCMELHPDKGVPREKWDELQEMNKQAMATFKN